MEKCWKIGGNHGSMSIDGGFWLENHRQWGIVWLVDVSYTVLFSSITFGMIGQDDQCFWDWSGLPLDLNYLALSLSLYYMHHWVIIGCDGRGVKVGQVNSTCSGIGDFSFQKTHIAEYL